MPFLSKQLENIIKMVRALELENAKLKMELNEIRNIMKQK